MPPYTNNKRIYRMKNKLKKIFEKFDFQKENILSKLFNAKIIKIERNKLKTIGKDLKKRFSVKFISIFESTRSNEVIKSIQNSIKNPKN